MLSISSIGSLASKVFGSSNDRKVRRYQPMVEKIMSSSSWVRFQVLPPSSV